jgi:flagellar hook-associated protein FlgK
MKLRSISTACIAIALVVLAASACSFLNRSTPTATFKAFFEASKKKDVPAMKKNLSKGTLDMFDKLAKAQGKSTDDILNSLDKDSKDEKLPETRNEKITGDTATLEVKNEKTDKWDTLPFVKENGEWKIAMDKFIEDMMKGLGEKIPEIK